VSIPTKIRGWFREVSNTCVSYIKTEYAAIVPVFFIHAVYSIVSYESALMGSVVESD